MTLEWQALRKLTPRPTTAALAFLLVLATACAHQPPPASPPPVLPPVAVLEPPASSLEEAHALQTAGKLEVYERSLRFLSLSADPLTSRRAVALLGLHQFEQKHWDDAFVTLTNAAAADPLVAPYLQLRLIEVEQNRDHVQNSAGIAAQIIASAPDSSATVIARLRLPGLYAQLGDRAATDAAYAQATAIPIDEQTEEELVALATQLDKAGRNDLATSIRMRLLTTFPQGRFTEKTYGQLTALANSPIEALSFGDSVALALSLVHHDRYDQAFDLLGRIARRFPDSESDASYRNVRYHALFGARHYSELIAATDGMRLEAPAILLRARAAWRAGHPEVFLHGLSEIEREFPSSKEAAEAKALRAKYYVTDVTDYAQSVKNLREAIDAGEIGNDGENLWTLGWTYVLWGHDAAAINTFDEYLKRFPDADYTSNSLFWSGKVLKKLGRPEERDRTFRALIEKYPYTYYSYRARQIMSGPESAKAGPQAADREPQTASSTPAGQGFPAVEALLATVADPRLDTVRELDAIDLFRDASQEMKRVAAAHPDNLGVQFMLADVYVRGGEPFKANGILQRRFREFVRHGGIGIPHRFWEILFPLNYWATIESEARKRGLDPYLIASIIRQESGFEPHVVSNAGAVGLMQIMPAEAESIAARAEIAGVTRQALFDPIVNIAVGVAEFSQKLASMHNNPTLAIAAYNAGEDAVGKWLAHTPVDDVDLFVETIPYAETRLYVKSVTRNRFEYRRIYESSISPAPSE
jgi:soluble lytic murein transglycosylase